MRRSRLMASLAVVAVGAVALLMVAGSGADDPPTRTGVAATLDEAVIEAGSVEVTIIPLSIDGDGASFRVTFETHSVELDLDLVRAATLRVSGTRWPASRWDGDSPGGHHREGDLIFDARGDPTGPITLAIDGLPGPVEATWTP